jgi:hypothetical protein
MVTSFRQLIDDWGGSAEMAADIGASVWAIKKWHQRDSIPSEWWLAIVSSAPVRNLDVTLEALALFAARRLSEAAE